MTRWKRCEDCQKLIYECICITPIFDDDEEGDDDDDEE